MADDQTTDGARSVGKVLEIKGVVVDAVFPGNLPEINGLTNALRAAPHEPFAGVVLGPMRRRMRLRLAPAAAAMAVAAVGLGSILASTAFQGGSVARFAQHVAVSPETASAASAPDTMNISTSKAMQTLRAQTRERIRPRPARSLRGGPVVSRR